MADKVANAAEELAEALTQACKDAMAKAGFPPSEQLLDKFHQEIKYALTLR